METSKVVIRKYGNRRLYDTSGSRYINLEDIAELVRNGTEVQILDAKTGADLTGSVLTQIIAEGAKNHPSGLPLELLRQLIVASDHAGQEFIMWYLKSAFDSYKKVQSSLEDKLSELRGAAAAPFQTIREMMKSQEPPKPGQPDPQIIELELLRKRVAELEARERSSHRQSAKPRKRTAVKRSPAKARRG